MKKPTISIGIPTFNQGDYLEETILSVLNQTVKPFEVVISDNHCTDPKSIEILEKYAPLVKIIKPKSHLSMMDNWNFLCQNLKGDYISLISSDDFYNSNFVECFYKCYDPRIGLYRFGFNIVDKNSNLIESKKIKSVPRIQKYPYSFLNQFNGPKVSFAAFVLKKSQLRDLSYFNNSYKLYGDWDLWLRMSKVTPFYYSNKIVSNYRTSYRPGIDKERLNTSLNDINKIYNYIQKETRFNFYCKVAYSIRLNSMKFSASFDNENFDKIISRNNLFVLNRFSCYLLDRLIRFINLLFKYFNLNLIFSYEK